MDFRSQEFQEYMQISRTPMPANYTESEIKSEYDSSQYLLNNLSLRKSAIQWGF